MSNFPTKVMHADDDEDIIYLTREALSHIKGLQLASCINGEELLSKLRTFQPEMILLDLKMKTMNGVDTIERLVDQEIRTPIVILTGYRDFEMKDKYKKLNIIGVLHKPVSPGMLPEKIRYLWVKYKTGKDELADLDKREDFT